jgi:ParB family chromosome partitioning protein
VPPRKRRKAAEKGSRGLTALDVAGRSPSLPVEELARRIEADGGSVLARFRDPLGGHWQLLAALPIDKVEPTPFQRDLSDAHVKRLGGVIDTLGRFLDPIIAVRSDAGVYWTPNGHHRLSAMRRLGAKSIVALVLPEPEVAYKILALNTEKAHNLREKSLEVIRMARDLATFDKRAERDFALEFEEAAFLTLGVCYEKNGRSAEPLSKALTMRESRAARVLELEEAVSKAMTALKEKGFESPYLRAFVVARINPLRFHKGEKPSFDATLEKMITSAVSSTPPPSRPTRSPAPRVRPRSEKEFRHASARLDPRDGPPEHRACSVAQPDEARLIRQEPSSRGLRSQ